MERMNLFADLGKEHVIVAFGAHPDDIELGAGGTLLRIKDMAEKGILGPVKIYYVVFGGSDGIRAEEARNAALKLGVRVDHIYIHKYCDTLLPNYWHKIVYWMVDLRDEIQQETKITHVLTHYTGDVHQDHRTVAESTRCVFRDHLIFEYEIVKYDGDLATPNFYVDLGDDGQYADRKIELLAQCFKSREEERKRGVEGKGRSHLWWDERLFRGHMRLRGVEANCIYAEGFHIKKLIW